MSSIEVFQAIEKIAATPGKLDKISLLTDAIAEHGDLIKSVLHYAYNPFVTFGIRKLPAVQEKNDPTHFGEVKWQLLLDDLSSRKLTGHSAQEAVHSVLASLDDESEELLRRILRKDLKAGFSESTINKVIKGFIPTFPYMRCSLPKHTDLGVWDWANGIFSQEKADGMFVNINHDQAGASMTTRQGTPLPYDGFEALHAEIERRLLAGTQTHGEMLVIDAQGKVMVREDGNGLLNSIIQGGQWPEGHYPILKVWDQVPLTSVVPKGKYDKPYDYRLAFINKQLKDNPGSLISLIETRVVRSLGQAYAHCKEVMLQGKEGTIIKRRQMIWRDYTSKDQVKLKLEAECELEVIDFVPGDETGKHKDTFGSLRCTSSCGQVVVDVSGFTDDKRKEIHAKGQAYLGTIITVRSNAILYSDNLEKKPHSLFLPRFVEERFDKSVADDLVRIEEQFANAIDKLGMEEAA